MDDRVWNHRSWGSPKPMIHTVKSIKEAVGQGMDGCLYWRSNLGTPKERRYVKVAGVGPEVEITPFTESLECIKRAVEERVFQVKGSDGLITPPRPLPGVFAETLLPARKVLVPLLPKTAPVSHDAFVNSYSGRKKQRYREALDKIRNGRFCPETAAEVSVFVKFEKTDRTSKRDPVPRVISPRDPQFNVRIGRYLKHLEKPLFKAVDGMFGETTIMKGLNSEQAAAVLRGKWDSYVNPVAVGLDASRFDQHVSFEALQWEHDVYLNCFPANKHKQRLARLLKCQLVNFCRGRVPDGEVVYCVRGTRMSGDMNTSMGNCLLMCSMIYCYLEHIGVDAKLANNGDDCVLFLDKADLPKLSGLYDWFMSVGFNMAIEDPVDEFEQFEFCQTKPVFDGTTWVMCRKPLAIAKDSVLLHPWDKKSDKYFRAWLDSVGVGGLRLAGRIPIFQEFYSLYKRSGSASRKYNMGQHVGFNMTEALSGMKRDYGAITPQCRASFYYAFGITPDEQECLEKFYRGGNLGRGLGEWNPRFVMGSVY